MLFLGVLNGGGVVWSLNEWTGSSIDLQLRSFMVCVGVEVGTEGAGRPGAGDQALGSDSPHLSTI